MVVIFNQVYDTGNIYFDVSNPTPSLLRLLIKYIQPLKSG